MDILHFASYCAAIGAFFIWIQWQRKNRLLRVLGAAAIIIGFALIFPWAFQRVWPR